MLLKLTGSSCSGKTTIAHSCADVPGLVVVDFDEVGVPVDADRVWRQRTMEWWVREALKCQSRGIDVLLTGQSPLGEVLASPSSPLLDAIAVCLLDVQDDERLRRLSIRDPDKWDRDAQRAFIGWARWHREHAVDPTARPEVITSSAWEEMRWQRWNEWTKADRRWCTTIIDTTASPISHSTTAVRRWIKNARADRASGRLPLASGWAA
jgi:hypothetical protein